MTPRQHTGIEVSANLTNWLRTQPAESWGEAIGNLDVETNYMLVFACVAAASFAIIFPWFITNFLIIHLVTLIVPAQADFVIE